FSVPSKVLSYLSAGRPTIALLPDGNPAAIDVLAAGGFVAAPSPAGASAAADWLADAVADGTDALAALGARARQLAERKFDIEAITDRFEQILSAAAGRGVEQNARPNAAEVAA
ncbi:MAG: hypothetical protein QOH89_3715, partial [Pseudonocardiales bacterium]|nr:hypothetical protein [Pseudonocardiales bacterium]